MGEFEGTDGQGVSTDVAASGVGGDVEAATADLLGPELNAYASGYSDAVNQQDPPPLQPDTIDLYAAGYGEGIGEVIAGELADAEMRAQGMPTAGPISEEELRASDAEMERRRKQLEDLLGRPEGPDEEAIDPRGDPLPPIE